MNPVNAARLLLRLDTAANVGLAAVVAAGGPLLARAAGLSSGWTLVPLLLVLLANGVLCWRAAAPRLPSATALRALGTVDLVFAAGVLAVAVLDPTTAATSLRWALGVLGDIVLIVGTAKLLLAARLPSTLRVDARRVVG